MASQNTTKKTLPNPLDDQEQVLLASGNILVLGGPGSGKTTVAILKANKIVRESLKPYQKIIFLSFARATVGRVLEALIESEKVSEAEKRLIEVDTYHAFFWRIIRTHGYLLGLPRTMSILTPADESIALASIRNDYSGNSKMSPRQRKEKTERENVERRRLAFEEGKLCFGLFADYASQLLQGSKRIRTLLSEAYPFVILDEFQDTNDDQWNVIKAIGQGSQILVLADPLQRIYDFAGACPERIDQFREAFQPSEFDFKNRNYRSNGTEIALFGNDIVDGQVLRNHYEGVEIVTYPPNQNQALSCLKGQVLQARRRIIDSGKKNWSLAVLVPTKKMTRLASNYLRSNQSNYPAVLHTAAVEMEGAILAAEIIAFLLQPKAPKRDFEVFVEMVCRFYEGRGGDIPTKGNLKQAQSIRGALTTARADHAAKKTIRRNSLIRPMADSYKAARNVELTGDPDSDWKTIRSAIEEGQCTRLREVAEESRNLGLLDRGTQLRSSLADRWRESQSYIGALDLVRNAFVREHFASAQKPESGVVVMNMHKAKGKQFDEVIIFEGWPRNTGRDYISNPDRIVLRNSKDQNLTQARQNLRVSVTRAKTRATILTPQNDICVLLR